MFRLATTHSVTDREYYDPNRFVRFSYYIGDQFINPYGSSGSLPLLSYYV